MKKRWGKIIPVIAALSVIPTIAGCAADESKDAIYLGVLNEDEAERKDVLGPDSKVYRFLVDGEEHLYSVAGGRANYNTKDEYYDTGSAQEGVYDIQNILMKGDSYRLTIRGEKVVKAIPLEEKTNSFKPVVEGIPGKKTVKNFLATCFEPLGTTLYVYGGGWDFQDTAAANQARSIGVSDKWVEFFNYNDADYVYDGVNKDGVNYYPKNAWNKYYYNGLDCSAYVGWSVYNLMNTESLAEPGYVVTAKKLAKYLAQERGLGTWKAPEVDDEKGYSKEILKQLKPGDIVSVAGGHVYIVVGRCSDDSMVIIDSTVSGSHGSGVQLGYINADGSDSKDCEAYNLATEYSQKYYPEWSKRYSISEKPISEYLNFEDEESKAGVFSWNTKNVLKDDEGYRNMSADEVLKDLFKDASVNQE